MKKLIPGATNFFAGSLLMFFLVGQFAFKEDEQNRTAADYKWQPPKLPTEMSFAGEAVPLERWEVKERLDREVLFNFYGQANILYLLKLSNRYFPLISERLKANGVPDDFKYLCVAESNLVATAISKAGAVSFWQFMPGTAPGFNLTINSEVDERYNVEKATDAACKYLKNAYSKFGSWTAAAASYNCGQGGYNSHATFQRTTNYYDLLLPEETNRYIFRILAFKHLLGNAEQLGFSLREEDKYQPVPHRMVRIDHSIGDLAQFAISNGTTYKMLKLMNPWLRGKTLTVGGGKVYEIKLPER
ncbi:MAG TPA: lytic transglycosylase domain-containing protein [Chitinophagaceae bacterium]|nr:lytic transglycosylase domain-containing protein [Chitinophagaceae bacterium]